MARFNKGDRVQITKKFDNIPNGARGTVIESSIAPHVVWDEPHGGTYECLGHNNVYAVDQDDLILIEEDDEDFGINDIKVLFTLQLGEDEYQLSYAELKHLKNQITALGEL